jgi:hypothetical protein
MTSDLPIHSTEELIAENDEWLKRMPTVRKILMFLSIVFFFLAMGGWFRDYKSINAFLWCGLFVTLVVNEYLIN